MNRRRDLFLAALAVAVVLAIVALLASGAFRRVGAEDGESGARPIASGSHPQSPGRLVAGSGRSDRQTADPPPVTSRIGDIVANNGSVGTAIYTASASWCAPTPDKCQDWGGNARLAAVNSFRFGDEPYPVRVYRGDIYVDVTVVSHCGCFGKDGYIDLSPSAFAILEPDLGIGRIDVEVEVLTDLPPHPDDERMRDEVRDVLPATDSESQP